ncbi:MAG: hypothetical protein ACRCSN_07655 [Dermatophilaceae bacterium]
MSSAQLASVLLPYLALVALLSGAAALGIRCGRAADAGVVVAEVLLIARAVVDVVDVVHGPRVADAATHLGYVVVSVVLLPLLIQLAVSARSATEVERTPRDRSRARHMASVLACAALMVVVARQTTTGAG